MIHYLAVAPTQTVYQVHSAYLKDGETALEPQSHGGRRRANLLLAEEEALLANFVAKAESGSLLVMGEIITAYEKAVGRHVAPSITSVISYKTITYKIIPHFVSISISFSFNLIDGLLSR